MSDIRTIIATKDKETKNTYRYLIDPDSEEGITGSIYVNKEEFEGKAPKIIKVKVNLG